MIEHPVRPVAFEAFFRQWFPSVARSIALVVRDVELGQDIAQELRSAVAAMGPHGLIGPRSELRLPGVDEPRSLAPSSAPPFALARF